MFVTIDNTFQVLANERNDRQTKLPFDDEFSSMTSDLCDSLNSIFVDLIQQHDSDEDIAQDYIQEEELRLCLEDEERLHCEHEKLIVQENSQTHPARVVASMWLCRGEDCGGDNDVVMAAVVVVLEAVAARGDEWCGGSYRSGGGKYFWFWPESSPKKFFGGGRRWPAVAADGEEGEPWERLKCDEDPNGLQLTQLVIE
nr:phospholipase-like protein [Tanacetum cinerariifolium]